VGVFGAFCIGEKVPFSGIKQNGFYGENFCRGDWGMIWWKIVGKIGDFNLNFSVWTLAEKCQSICGL